MNDDSFRFCQADAADADVADAAPDDDYEIFEANDDILDYFTDDPGSDPKIRSSRPDSATPEEGTLGTVTLDELFYLLSNGALGVEPKRALTSPSSSTPTSSTMTTDDSQDYPQSVNTRE